MGIYLSSPKIEKSSEDGENGKLRYGMSSMQGWRSTMEDAHAAYPDLDSSTSFFGVYDGHGGKEVARFCAKHLHNQLLTDEAYLSENLGVALRKAFLRMDEMMCGPRGFKELILLGENVSKVTGRIERLIKSPRGNDLNRKNDSWSTEEGVDSNYTGPSAGSTACVAVIQNNVVVVANAGDSRCVLSRNGQAIELSKDHKPDIEIEKDRILNAGGFVQYGRVNGNLNLTRAIGDMELKQNKALPAEKQIITADPDVTRVELQDGDEFLVLACDGIWDCLTSQQLVDLVREKLKSETKLSAVCEKVLDACLAPSAGGEGCDNMTMILVQFQKHIFQCVSSDANAVRSDEQS